MNPKQLPSNIQPTPLLLGSHTTDLEVPQQYPRQNTDASVINDVGDNKQLKFASQTSSASFPGSQAGENLVAGIGATFSDVPSDLASPASFGFIAGAEETPPYSQAALQKSHTELREHIRAALQFSTWPESPDEEFLPFDKLDDLITAMTIEKELLYCGVGRHLIAETVRKIRGITSRPIPDASDCGLTTRRKLFAILVLMNQVRVILDLIDEDVLDKDLPFMFAKRKRRNKANLPLLRKSPGGSGPLVPVRSLEKLDAEYRDMFESYQWRMLSPFLQLSSPGAPKVHHYPLDSKTILPFIGNASADGEEVTTMCHMGGLSEVHKVKIHPRHHNLLGLTAPERENPFFAVKILKEGTKSADFEQEVNSLKRVMEGNHRNLVRLLGTFERRGRYHLIFHWADANLEQFWVDQFPHPDDPPRDLALVRWLAREFWGLADALRLVHWSPILKDNKQMLQPVSKKIYGRHGDIKAHNILWFRNGWGGRGEGDMGVLQIADFGFAAFHSQASIEQPALMLGRSQTHRAPEVDGTVVSPLSDCWSLGVVLLEFVVWYFHGCAGFNTFSTNRTREDLADPPEDKFFLRHVVLDGRTGHHRQTAEVKRSVREQIESLRRHERYSSFFSDVLDFIEGKLLLPKVDERADCQELVDTLRLLHLKCQKSYDYCTKKLRTTTAVATPTVELESEGERSFKSDESRTTAETRQREDSFATQRTTLTRETTAEGEPYRPSPTSSPAGGTPAVASAHRRVAHPARRGAQQQHQHGTSWSGRPQDLPLLERPGSPRETGDASSSPSSSILPPTAHSRKRKCRTSSTEGRGESGQPERKILRRSTA